MSERGFSLQPFHQERLLSDLKITGTVSRRSNNLALRSLLLGDWSNLMIPAPSAVPERRTRLWEETCFEFFLALRDSPRYWEFNLSPAGHWNVYRFEGHRQGMVEEVAYTSLPFTVRNQPDSLSLFLVLNLDKIVRSDQNLGLAVSAIIRHRDGRVTYWALAHSGREPDFHRREDFIISL